MNMEEEINKLKAEVATIKSLLQKVLNPEGKIDLNMTIEEMLVHITNRGRRTIAVDTTILPGKILYCALKDFKEKTFRESDMAHSLDENGWHTSHGGLAPQLSKMAAPAGDNPYSGLLIKEKEGYRLPTKVSFTGDEL